MDLHDDTKPLDETFEARAAGRLVLRGCASAAASGVAWHVPTGSTVFGILAVLVSVALIYAAVLPLIVAAATLRNMVVRRFDLGGRVRLARWIGILILGTLLALAALAFTMTRLLFGS